MGTRLQRHKRRQREKTQRTEFWFKLITLIINLISILLRFF
ncbi:hypothetical protein [Tuanshanicoccus yangjingiae]